MKQKVLIIGLDGATWDIIKPLADEGELPTFKKLMDNGVWGNLESTIPPWTIPAWESMTTGKNPKKLGFATFMVKKGYKFFPYFMKYKRQLRIWDILSEAGYKVIVANLPNVVTAQKINGCMIAGWFCHNKKCLTYPNDLIKKLDKICNGYKIDIFEIDEEGEIIKGPTYEEYINECEHLLQSHYNAFTYLLEQYDWDFAFIVFVTPDRIQHRFWNKKILTNHYKNIDRILNDILEKIEKDENVTVIIVSDHGFSKIKYTLHINEFLIKNNFLKIDLQKEQKKINKILFKINNYAENKKVLEYIKRKIIARILPKKIYRKMKNKSKPINFERMNIDWDKTRAFAYSVCGDIYLNIKKRDPKGIIENNEYEKVRNEIIEKIKKLSLENKIDIEILKKEEIYPGSHMFDNLPDIIILPTKEGIQNIDPYIGCSRILTISKKDRNICGNHILDGIFIAYGPGIKKGHKLEKNIKIYDIMPTILHIFGLEIPNDIDGRVLLDIFENNSEFIKNKPKYTSSKRYYEKLKIKNIAKEMRDKL